MADKKIKQDEITQQATPETENRLTLNPIEEILAMKAAADQRREAIKNEISALCEEMQAADRKMQAAESSEDFQAIYEKVQALNAMIIRKKAEAETVTVDFSEDAILTKWNAFAEKHAAEMKESLEEYRKAKRALYEMMVAIAEKHNDFLLVRWKLGNELHHITKNPFSEFELDVPVHLDKYDVSAANYFNNIIKKGDYLQCVLNAITEWNIKADLDNPESKTLYDQVQRPLGF